MVIKVTTCTLATFSISSVAFLTGAVRATNVSTVCFHITHMASIAAFIDIWNDAWGVTLSGNHSIHYWTCSLLLIQLLMSKVIACTVTWLSIPNVSIRTGTVMRAIGVCALCIHIANMDFIAAFIDIYKQKCSLWWWSKWWSRGWFWLMMVICGQWC